MKWLGRRTSRNIEDRRRSGRDSMGGAGGIGGLGLVAVLVLGFVFDVDVSALLDGQGGTPSTSNTNLSHADQQMGEFVAVVLADTEEVWHSIFQSQIGEPYTAPTLVLFKGATQSRCGGATAATGPFYCPADQKAYLDTAFFTILSQRLGAGGDFAAAYVIAHEVAHHVQNELGILGQANRIRAQVSPEESNAISVRIELQADCFSGVWANHAQQMFGSLEQGDIGEAVNAARQIGDDTLQRNAGRVVQPHTFTHGSSAQRQRWFERGLESGELSQCDTFSTDQL